MKSIALGFFSSGIIFSALLVVTSLKPINAIISLIMAFLNGIGLFILLGEDFIGLLYCIIYIGAIVILFLFVIMLLNIQRENLIFSLAFFRATRPMALLIGGLYLLVFSNFLTTVAHNYGGVESHSLNISLAPEILASTKSYYYGLNTMVGATAHSTEPTLNIKPTWVPIDGAKPLSNIGEMFYKEWGYEMLLVLSLILLVGMIGAIVLTFHTKKLSNGSL